MDFDDEPAQDHEDGRDPNRSGAPLTDSEAFWAILTWAAIDLVVILLFAAFAPPMYR